MNFRQPQPQDLAAWLDLSTGDLVPSAQARVRAEIEVHCADAMHAYLKNGRSEPQAEAAALADLGDAEAAARRFRRQYLTRREAACLLASKYTTILYTFYGGFFGASVLWMLAAPWLPASLQYFEAAWATLGGFGLALSTLSAAATWLLTRGEGSLANLRRRHLCGLLLMFNLISIIAVGACFVAPPHSEALYNLNTGLLLVASLGYYVFEWLVIRRKLLSATDGDLPL